MAIITTKYAFGWFGAEAEQCESFDLSRELGTYSYSNVKLNFDIVYEKRRSFAIYSIQN